MSELIKYDNAQVYAQAAAQVNSAVAYEGIFNAHGDAADAEQTSEAIRDDSIVFIEGTILEDYDKDWSQSLKQLVEILGTIRVVSGKTDENYLALKAICIDELDDHLQQPAKEDQDRHGLYLTKNLVLKDCAVFVADIDLSRVSTSLAASILPHVVRALEKVGITWDSLESENSPLKSYMAAMGTYQNYVSTQHAREKLGTMASIYTMTKFLNNTSAPAQDLARSSDGRLQAYTVWGRAHTYSLVNAYEEAGIPLIPKIIGGRPLSYIPRENSVELARRRVVIEALLATMASTGFMREHVSLIDLNDRVVCDTETEPPIHIYNRIFQLYKKIKGRYDVLMEEADPETAATAEAGLLSDVHNVCNLLRELGLDPRQYLADPLIDSNSVNSQTT